MHKVLILGSDGFCGWPTSLNLSKNGFDVYMIDNFSRRNIDIELNCSSLTPICHIQNRINAWEEISGRKMQFSQLDISDEYYRLLDLIKKIKPDTIIHFAEQKSAPYSMKSSLHRRYTVNKNMAGSHNVLDAIVESGLDIHLVHLGTTGVYGYSSIGMEIPEGYLDVKVDVDGQEKEMTIPYPPNAGSVYHMTKTMDALMFTYYNKHFGVRITDLHQGIVWGTQTEETKLDIRLINRFDYDGDWGTVLNRFILQAVVSHPITIHGSGGQTRAFINIQDTVNCLKIAVENPPEKGESVKIFNQTTEQLNILDLAKLISKMTGAKIRYYKNPRLEDSANELKIKCDNFLNLGLTPITLNEGLLTEILEIAVKYKYRCDQSKIICESTWLNNMEVDYTGSETPV